MAVQASGTIKSPLEAERRDQQLGQSEVKVKSSRK